MLPAEASREPGSARPAPRALTHGLRELVGGRGAALLGALAIALAGCGGDDDDGSTGGGEPATELMVTLDVDGPGGEPPLSDSVSCTPEAGDRSRACAAAERLRADDAAPVPPNVPCTQIYGGPAVATVTGTIAGEAVDARLTRADGCQIERFNRFADLFEALFPGYDAARPG